MANYSTHLKEGEQAPNFKVTDQDGKEVQLTDFKGRKVIVYFYPKDDTPSCTNQACNLRDNYQLLQQKGYVILGVSADEEKKHAKFSKKYNLPFQLLADVDKKIIDAYDVWGQKKFMGRSFDGIVRTTFVIDEKGFIKKIIKDVITKKHTAQIMENE